MIPRSNMFVHHTMSAREGSVKPYSHVWEIDFVLRR